MHAIRANFIASYSRARNLIQSDEPENPTILFSSTTSFFLFFPFFSLEKREREREIYQDSPLVSARRASLSARRYEEDVYDARRNFSLKLPTRYSSICAYQEVDNGVLFREGGALCRRPIFYPARSIVVYRSSVIIKWDSTYERSWKIVLNRHAYIYIY